MYKFNKNAMIDCWVYICFLVLSLVLGILTTIVFCFWFVYLLDALRRKWKIYRRVLKCLQEGVLDLQQHMLIHNSKTELVKNVFLFFMNIVEWSGFLLAYCHSDC